MNERKLKLIEELIIQRRDRLNIDFLLDLIVNIINGKISILDGWEKELNILRGEDNERKRISKDV